MYYITFRYTRDTLRALSQLTVTIDLIGQSVIMHAQYTHCVLSQTIAFILSLHQSSFNVKPHMFPMGCNW